MTPKLSAVALVVPFVLLGVVTLVAPGAADEAANETEISAVLDDFHNAASEADSKRYFSHFTEDAVFLGTDPGERWTVAQFQEYAEPHFSQGRGWTYVPINRHVAVAASGGVAWFDELLDNEKYGQCRGTGVLAKTEEGWKIAHYSLTLVVPNDVAQDVAEMIRDAEVEPETPDEGPTSDE